jgi:hypothetical protein
MNPELLANEMRFLIQAMPKGCYLILSEAIQSCGGEIRIPVDRLRADSLRLPMRTEVEVDGNQLVIRALEA